MRCPRKPSADPKVWLVAALAGLATWCGLSHSQTMPATAPAYVRKPGIALKGTIVIPADWALQPPDLSRAVVFLGSAPALDAEPPPAAPIIVAQRNKSFDPGFSVIAIGSSVEFPNWDHFDHNVFSRSPAAPAFDLARYPYGQSKSIKFEKAGAIQLFCNIHPDMRAIIYVTPNSFFTRADAAGKFQINDVPTGDFELVIWNDRCSEVHQKIAVRDGMPDLSVSLREDRDAILSNDPPKEKQSYGVERGLSVKHETLNLPVVQGTHAAPEGH